MNFENSFFSGTLYGKTTCGFKEAVDQSPGVPVFGSQKVIRTKNRKGRAFDFKKNKETRRKGTNASQLAIINFYDIMGKHMNTSCVFHFYMVFFKCQNI